MLNHLAAPRMATISHFFSTQSEEDLLGAYAWTQAVAAALWPVMGDFEVFLRNALHRALSRHYGNCDSFDWMRARANPVSAKAKPFPARHRMDTRQQEDISKIEGRIKKPLITPDDIVAHLTFGFWEKLIAGLWHASQPQGLNTAILQAVFPYAPQGLPHGDRQFKQQVERLLQRLRDVRNRIGHHDAIWTTPEFDARGVLGFIPRRPRHTVNSLHLLLQRVQWFAGWIHPEIASHIGHTAHWQHCHALLSQQTLAHYRATAGRDGSWKYGHLCADDRYYF